MALLLLAACTSSNASRSDRAATGDHHVPKLTVAVPQDRGPLSVFAAADDELVDLVYDKLQVPSPYVADPQPWLAQQVRQLDPATWEVQVRQGVTWHDGAPLTAEDVRFTFEYFRTAPSSRWTHHVNNSPDIRKVETTSADTVRFTCADPCPELGSVTLADLPIVPKHVWESVTEPLKHTGLPVGTGPYRLVEYDATRGYRFQANPSYFAGAPLVDELVMPLIADPSATFTALRAGDIDAALRPVPPELVEQFRRDGSLEVASTKPLSFVELRLNFRRAPFDRPEFRRAMSTAIDRKDLLDTVILGQGRRSDKGYPHPDSPWTNPNLSTPTDPAAARRLLDGLNVLDLDGDGYRERPDGSALALTIKAPGTEPTQLRAGELIVNHLKAVGIRASVQAIDFGAVQGLFRPPFDWDMHISRITAHGIADPNQFIVSHRGVYLWDSPGRPYPEFDALYEKWVAASTLTERKALLFAMQELFNRQPTAIPLFYPDEYWAYRPSSFDGWVETPGLGIVHKWSFLPHEVGHRVKAISREFR